MAINTLITIKDAITAFADGHGQLQGRVIFEADDHRSAYITEENTYPLLFVAPIDVAVNRAMNVHTLRVYVYERINDDRVDVWENANDTSLILRDIRVWWNDYGVDDINIVDDPIGQFGCDKELDNLVGYFADIRFEIPSHGRCQVPVDVTPIPTPSCADAVQVIEDSLGNELYSNSIPSGATETQVIQDSTYTVEYTNGTLIESGSILAEGSVTVQVPDPVVCEDVDVFVGEALVGTYSGGTDVFVTVTQDGFDVIPEDVVVTGSAIDIVLADSVPCADTTIEVNGTIEGTVASGSTVDIQLSDSGGVVTPTSVTQVGNDLQVVLPDAAVASPRSTATLMKTGQTTSYRTGDDGDLEVGRATSFLVLDTAPLHNNGAATINTTTNRFTDTLGGSTYANDWVLDWSTWNGSTLLGYYRSAQTAAVWNDAVDNSLGTFGAFVGCRLANIRELMNICHMENGSASFLQYINYAPFSYTGTLWTSTSLYTQPTFAWSLGIGSPGLFVYVGKTTTHKYMPVRTFSLSTSNVLS